jgi:hypothetical protein
MPSPFPGMDPYLEGSLWMSIHTQVSAEIARQLAPKLRPRYLALTSERFVFETPEDVSITTQSTYPDVGVTRTKVDATCGTGAGLATAPLYLTTIMPEPAPQVTVEIRDTANRQLVAAIEVLSPGNKRGDGREEYLAKRGRILHSSVHLVEIDLLRAGKRVPMKEPLPSVPYFVFVTRVEDRPKTAVYPVPLDQPLPTVPIPLLPGDADVYLDLQQALTNVYDLLGYDLAVDYSRPPEIPLPSETETWTEEILRNVRRNA